MKNKITEISVWWIIIFFFINLVEKVLFTFGIFSIEPIAYSLYMSGLISFILVIINFKVKKEKIRACDILIFLLILCGIISTIFSKEVSVSIFGSIKRYEGFLSLLSYYFLFMLSTFIPKKEKEFIITMLLTFGAFETFYAIFQSLGVFENFYAYGNFPMGLVGNSMFFSTEAIMWLSLAIGKYLFSNKKYWFYLVLLFSVGTFLSGAMSAIVALTIVLFFVFFYLLISVYKKKLSKNMMKKYGLVVLGIIGMLLLSIFINQTIWNDIKEMIFQLFNITINQEINDNYGTNRIYIWRNTLQVVPKYLLHGVGIDCFLYAFPNPLMLPISIPRVIDKAHNEFLQLLLTEGIFALTIYISFLGMIIKNCLSNISTKESDTFALLLAIIAYLAQSFFNISLISIAPIFYIILGLAYQRGFYENASH